MAVVSALASLRASSFAVDVSPAIVTRTLGVIPTETISMGHRRGRFTQTAHIWLIQSGHVFADHERAMDRAAARVLGPLAGKDELVEQLADVWDWDLRVSGFADGSQTGFVLTPWTLKRAGELGLYMLGEVFTSSDD